MKKPGRPLYTTEIIVTKLLSRTLYTKSRARFVKPTRNILPVIMSAWHGTGMHSKRSYLYMEKSDELLHNLSQKPKTPFSSSLLTISMCPLTVIYILFRILRPSLSNPYIPHTLLFLIFWYSHWPFPCALFQFQSCPARPVLIFPHIASYIVYATFHQDIF